MIDNDIFNTEELEELLSPRCDFHASDSLKDKIVKKTESNRRHRFRRYIPWTAAACVAAVAAISFIYKYDMDVQPKEFAENIKEQPVAIEPAEIPDESSSSALASIQTINEKKIDKQVSKTRSYNHTLLTENPQSENDDLQTNDDQMIFAMVSEDDSHIIPMIPSPEEIIRRQEESTLEYIDYMRQEIEYAQQLVKQQYEINQISFSHE